MAGLNARKQSRKALRVREEGDSFDMLCPELLDIIVQKAAEMNPRGLERLSQVSKAFWDSSRRCSRALVLHSPGRRLRSESETTQPLGVEEACSSLIKQMSLRPNLSKLVLNKGAETHLRQAALTGVRWSSVEADCACEQSIESFIELLLPSKVFLRKLDLDSIHSLRGYVDSHIQDLLRAFPGLETLTLRGRRRILNGSGIKFESVDNRLTSLDFANMDFQNLRDASLYLPDSLCYLCSLRLRWGTCNLSPDWPPAKFVRLPQLTHLQTLRVDIFYGWSSQLNSLLNDVAAHCPSLKRLFVHVSPYHTAERIGDRSVLHLPPHLSEKCPELEQIVIS